MSIQKKINKIQDLITEICQELENEQPTDETAEDKLNEVINHIDLTSDQIDDLEEVYCDYQDYLEIADEPPRDSWEYNGVSPKDFYEA